MALISPSLLYHVIEFPKASLALALVPYWFLAIQNRRHGLSAALVGLSMILHSSLVPVGIIFLGTIWLNPASPLASNVSLFRGIFIFLDWHFIFVSRVEFHPAHRAARGRVGRLFEWIGASHLSDRDDGT